MANAIIETLGLEKDFEGGRIAALRGINLAVRQGEFVSIMGPSGSGKSTLLNLIGAIDRPTSGEVLFNNVPLFQINNLSRFRSKKVGFIFQAFFLIPTLTAVENVEIPMFENSRSAKERRERALELLEQMGLAERAHLLPTKLSGGERQRVAIARSLANEPAILLADEPTGNLDSSTAAAIIQLLQEINQKQGMTIIMVTHDAQVASAAHRTVQMLDGQIVEPVIHKKAVVMTVRR